MSKLSKIEVTIVSLLKERNKKAIELIYDNYASALYGLIIRIVHTHENAEEVLQDALIKVWKNPDGYDDSKGRLFTWLGRICRNAAIDYTRSAKFKHSQRSDPFDTNVYNNEDAFAAEDISLDPGLAKMIDKLDAKYKKIIELAYFKQFTQTEIVKELDIPLGTVKSRIRIALRELRSALSGEIIGIIFLIIIN